MITIENKINDINTRYLPCSHHIKNLLNSGGLRNVVEWRDRHCDDFGIIEQQLTQTNGLCNSVSSRSNPRRYSRQIMALQEAEISRMASLAVIEDEDRIEQSSSKVKISFIDTGFS